MTTTNPQEPAPHVLEVLFRTLVEMPTVSDDVQANRQALRFVGDYLAERGMHVRHIPSTPLAYEGLLASSRANNSLKPRVLLAAHIDVVPGDQSMFTLRKADGKYFGRGVYDMKFAIAAYMHIVDTLQASLTAYDFAILLTADEELGGRGNINGTREVIKSGLRPQVVILPDGGEGWQLEAASNGYMHLVVEAHGKTGHSSRPWLAENAVTKLTDALHELKQHFKDQGPDTDTFNIAALRTKDIPANQIPDYAAAELSVRLRHPGALAHWQRVLTDLCEKHQLLLTERAGFEATHNDLEQPLVKRFIELVEAEVGIANVGFHSYAGADTRFFAEIGVPYINTYPYGGGHHGSDEWLAEASLEQFHRVTRRYIEDVARDTQRQEPTRAQRHLPPVEAPYRALTPA